MREPLTDGISGLVFTTLATLPSIAFIVAAALGPSVLGRPLTEDSPVSTGLVLGLALVVYLIVLALIYTARMNRRERNRPSAGAGPA